jgi:hypothetical protein
MRIIHFGIPVLSGKYGFNICAENYALKSNKSSFGRKMPCAEYLDSNFKIYTDDFVEKYYNAIMENYHLNMDYFATLDKDKFRQEVSNFVTKNKFVEVQDLTDYSDVNGYYVMVLDEYSQIYIGTSKKDILKRIKMHWTNIKSFDRLLLPMWAVKSSVMSIDSFRALDTTRIYIKDEEAFTHEDYYIKQFSKEFTANRINGGSLETMRNEGRLVEVKTHNLS